jgi:hypothetical protein
MDSSVVIIPVILPTTTLFPCNSLYSIQSPALNVTFSYINEDYKLAIDLINNMQLLI